VPSDDEILELDDFGENRRFRYRSDVFKTMKPTESRRFRSFTPVHYASVRGAAYGYGRRSKQIFKATLQGDVVTITLEGRRRGWGDDD
jgi:hypothetical protein